MRRRFSKRDPDHLYLENHTGTWLFAAVMDVETEADDPGNIVGIEFSGGGLEPAAVLAAPQPQPRRFQQYKCIGDDKEAHPFYLVSKFARVFVDDGEPNTTVRWSFLAPKGSTVILRTPVTIKVPVT